MDEHSEKELKYKCNMHDRVFHSKVDHLVNMIDGTIISFKKADGHDYFYKLNKSVLRLRVQNDKSRVELTYKARKSKKSISDRVEINVLLKDTESINAHHLLMALGAGGVILKLFKQSSIYHITMPPTKQLFKKVHLCLAKYDVYIEGAHKGQFLEIEIENNTEITDKEAMALLKRFEDWLPDIFRFEPKPLNKSLFELYSKKR